MVLSASLTLLAPWLESALVEALRHHIETDDDQLRRLLDNGRLYGVWLDTLKDACFLVINSLVVIEVLTVRLVVFGGSGDVTPNALGGFITLVFRVHGILYQAPAVPGVRGVVESAV